MIGSMYGGKNKVASKSWHASRKECSFWMVKKEVPFLTGREAKDFLGNILTLFRQVQANSFDVYTTTAEGLRMLKYLDKLNNYHEAEVEKNE